jgi:DNA-binding SARP family transcriptional activator
MNRVQAWSASSIPPLTVYTLGRFAVYRDNDLINDAAWQRRKAKNLFKLLLLAPNHQLLKDQVLEWLWPEQDPVRGANNLHRTLFVLRRVLQPDLTHAAASFYITFQDDVLTLNPAAIAWFDAAEFKRLVRLGREQNDALAHYEAARTLYQGDFLPDDLYEAWASEPRESLKSSYAQLLQQTAHVYTGQAAYAEAIACFKDLLTLDPTNEEVCCHLMGLYMQSGQRHQALQLYQRTCTTLQLELGVEPAPETTALYQTILAGRWKTETGPIPAPAKPAFHLLENKQAPLIGRQSELQQLESLLPQL